MFLAIVTGTALIAMLCVPAYILATFALPFMLAFAAARFAYDTGAGLVGTVLVGLATGAAVFGSLVALFATTRVPILRMALGVIFTAQAAVAGYALAHGVTGDPVASDIWRQVFCAAGGACAGLSALARLIRSAG